MSDVKLNQKRVEATLLAISKINGFTNPETICFETNNCLLVRSYARPGKNVVTEDGIRVFTSVLAGMKAGLFDLELKIKGQSRAGLKSTDTIAELLGCYGFKNKQPIDSVVAFLRRALKDETIKSSTPLSFYAEASPDVDKESE